MKTADILYTLDEAGIGIDHDGGSSEYCAYWPKENNGSSIIVQSKPENLIQGLLHSFQAVHLHHVKRIKEMEEYSYEKDKEIEILKDLLSEAFNAGCDFAASYEAGYNNAPNFTQWKKQQGL